MVLGIEVIFLTQQRPEQNQSKKIDGKKSVTDGTNPTQLHLFSGIKRT
jgi:hypothetical protein